jgi:predicted nucleic acid-binding Zn ribbon protein
MPVFTHVCPKCNLEKISMTSAGELHFCPYCNLEMQRRIVGGCLLIFKGSGFYSTDYQNHKPKMKRRS